MRFIYTLLIGLLLFNAMLIVFDDFFTGSPEASDEWQVNVENVTSSDSSFVGYGKLGSATLIKDVVMVSGGIIGVTAIASLWTKNPVYIGAGCFAGLVAGLWTGASKVLAPMLNQPYVSELYSIMVVAIGLLVVMSVIEIFTQQQGAN